MASPPGGTYFDTVKRRFDQVPMDQSKDNAISTSEFLEAAESLTTIFDVLGGAAFTPVKSDMTGNIKKVRTRQLAAPLESETLQDLVRNELKSKSHTATEGLLWLTRGLDFTAQGLRKNLSNSEQTMSTSFSDAYSETLKKYHGFVAKGAFYAAMRFVPTRESFYPKLGDDQPRVQQELDLWLQGLERRVPILTEFLARKEAKF